jgi:hypothetical protein
MYISKRQFTKQAIQIPAFITEIKAKYPNSEQDPEFRKIINQFFQYKNIKPLTSESQELVAILNDLPDNWDQAKEYMKSQINSLAPTSQSDQEKKIKPISSDDIKQSLISLGLKEEDLVKKEIRDWLYSRFVEKNKEEIHPIEDALPTLKKYSDNKSNIINKANRDQAFVQELSEEGVSTDKILNMQELSVDDMEFILEKYDDNKETSINTTNVETKPEEFVGKVGEWNIWLPSSQETSAKIAGYDEETKQPKTTWCTARTRGSNLFYHYISRGDVISFLFYIIKDNPSENNDWLSLGFTGNLNNGLESIEPYYGQDGGLTVNKANKGLRESDFNSILGSNKEEIFSLIMKKMNDLGGKNPATEEMKKYANNFELFKSELNKKNIEQKRDFCKIILELNPNKQVKELAKIWTSHYEYILKNKDNPNIAPFVDSILKEFAMKSSLEFLHNYSKEPFASEPLTKKYLPLAVKTFAEKNPYDFLSTYADKPWAQKYIPFAAKSVAENNPSYFLNNFSSKPWAQEYIPLAAKSVVEDNPSYFLKNFSSEPWAQKYIPFAAKSVAENNLDDFLIYYADKPWAQEYIPFAAKSVAEKSPSYFLSTYVNEPWAQEYIPLAARSMAEYNPSYFLKDYADAPWAQKYIPFAARSMAEYHPRYVLEDYADKPWAQKYIPFAAKSVAENNPFYFLNNFSSEPWAQEYIPFAAKSVAESNPKYFLENYADKPLTKKYLPLAAKRVAENNPKYFLEYYADKPWAQEYIPLAAKSVIEKNPSYFLENYAEEPWAQEPREELGGKSFLDLAREETKLASLVKSLNLLGFNKEASLVYKLIC